MTSEQAVIDFYVANNQNFKQAMAFSEHVFLGEQLAELRPKKILEIGVSYGGTTALILSILASLGLEDTQVDSIDAYDQQMTADGKSFRSGEMVEKTGVPHKNWRLLTGAPAFVFSDKLSNDYDLCIIDTLHSYPGELLDYLMVLPNLKSEATIIVHDLMLHWHKHNNNGTTEYRDDINCVFFSSLPGKKVLPHKYYYSGDKPNIGAVHLSKNAYDEAINIFNALTLRWAKNSYLDSLYKNPDFYNKLFIYFQKHYPAECMELYTAACYKNLNNDITALEKPSCNICMDKGNTGATQLIEKNSDKKCKKCSSGKLDRLCFNFLSKNFDDLFKYYKIFNENTDFIPSEYIDAYSGRIAAVQKCDDNALVILSNIDDYKTFAATQESFDDKRKGSLTVMVAGDDQNQNLLDEVKKSAAKMMFTKLMNTT